MQRVVPAHPQADGQTSSNIAKHVPIYTSIACATRYAGVDVLHEHVKMRVQSASAAQWWLACAQKSGASNKRSVLRACGRTALCRDKPAASAPLHSCYYHTLAVHNIDMVYMQAELRT
jgi:hypothetical protein